VENWKENKEGEKDLQRNTTAKNAARKREKVTEQWRERG
jgi:hypothetical protein